MAVTLGLTARQIARRSVIIVSLAVACGLQPAPAKTLRTTGGLTVEGCSSDALAMELVAGVCVRHGFGDDEAMNEAEDVTGIHMRLRGDEDVTELLLGRNYHWMCPRGDDYLDFRSAAILT